jgi:hypothetical protein
VLLVLFDLSPQRLDFLLERCFHSVLRVHKGMILGLILPFLSTDLEGTKRYLTCHLLIAVMKLLKPGSHSSLGSLFVIIIRFIITDNHLQLKNILLEQVFLVEQLFLNKKLLILLVQEECNILFELILSEFSLPK